MRTFASYRSMTPALIDDTLHQWVGDGSAGTMIDLCGYGGTRINLTESGTSRAAGFGALQAVVFDGSDDSASTSTSSGADKTAMVGSVTATIGFQLNSSFSANGTLVAYGLHYDSDKTCVFEVYIDDNKNLNAFWYNGDNEVLLTFTGYTFALAKPYLVSVVRDVSANNCKLYVLGELVETITSGFSDPSVTSSYQEWYAGCSWADYHFQHFKGNISSITIDHRCRTVDEIVRDARRALLWDGETSIFSRVKVKDHDGDWQDLSSLYGNNFYLGGTIDDSSDNATKEATFQIRREVYNACLSKYHDNLLNRPSDWDHIGPTHSYVEDGHEDLLDIGREIKHEWARMPLDSEPSSTDWRMEFHGYVTDIDWSGDSNVVSCRDLGAKYNAAYIERATVFPTDESDDHSLFHVICDGGSGDGIMDKLHSAGWVDGSCPTCYDEAEDGIGIEHWTQERAAALPVMQSMAEQVGQLFRWKWQYTADDFCPTLWTPARDKTFADCCLTANDYVKLTKLSVCIDDIRNAVQVLFQSKDPGSAPAAPALAAAQYGGWGTASGDNPGQYFVIIYGTDIDGSYSMTQYWRQFCEISEGSSGLITKYEQAERLAVAVCSDLYKPYALMSASLLLFPEIEIEDICYFAADDHHTTVDFRHAVFDVSHRYEKDGGGTTLSLRGKPSGGFKRHLLKEVRTCGALPGVRDQDDILAGRSSRHRLGPLQSVFEQSSTLRTNGEQLIANSDFNDQSFGTAAMPDCWFINTGTFNTSVSVETTNTKLGDKALKLSYNATTPVVYSKMFAVTDDCAMQFKYTFKADASGQRIGIRVLQYESLTDSSPDEVVVSNTDATTSWQTIITNIPVHSGKKLARVKLTAYTLTSGHYILYDMIEARKVFYTAYATNTTAQDIDKASDPVLLALDHLPEPPWSEGYNGLGAFDLGASHYNVQRTGIYKIMAGATVTEGDADQTWTARCDIYKDSVLLVSGPETAKTAATETSWVAYSGYQYLTEGDEIDAYITYTVDYTGSAPYADADNAFMYIDLVGE